ncbi:DUF1292 domain-containing protein [Proteiniborus sp. MB09-C3]|uniref:DUF1292 domain-containing protein n=1 Tax=Proteiniborus sp. MB09-C3 TaxID=3050072 RepID=UPI002553B696|nr:DUF1292 domain-containing protein [Proteiniborus sp. MB09-C3]WIV11185.1 DUF1292 domain-containing protein [Proteiniborus sp. MB09-C3]
MVNDDNIISLIDENGKEQKFEVMATFDIEEDEYAVLFPLQNEEAEDGAYILRIEYDENGELLLVNIEDEEELENAVAVYEAIADEIL